MIDLRTPLRHVALLLLVGFLSVALGAGYWGFVRAEALNARPDNARRVERERRVWRGAMLARDGETVLVETVLDEEGIAERRYHYPLLAPVTGVWTLRYTNTGLEASFDEWLAGRRGEPLTQLLDNLLHRPVRGYDLVLTVDPALQAKADALLGNRAGAIVVLDPRTGDILALASHPTYDPNTFDEQAEALQESPAHVLLNRATQGLYTPGSVFKIVTLAGVLEHRKARLEDVFEDTGLFVVNGFPVRDFQRPPQTRLDLPRALAYSSNVVFAQLGLRLGPDLLRETARAFGFGEVPPVDIEAVASSLGRDDFLLDQVGLANTAYGQGQVQVTPLHMALMVAGIVNDGVMPRPRLVQEVRTPDGQVLRRFKPSGWRRAVSRRTAAQVREAMIISARDGYARAGAPPGIAIGGKTGTAQLGGNQPPHAWFVAFAPADDPRVVVVVLVENGGIGGQVAAPLARALIQQALE